MDNFMISFIVFLVFIFAARTISEKASKKLSTEKKAELIDLFSKSRTRTFGLLIVIIAAYFLALKYRVLDPMITLSLYIILLLGFIVYNAVTAKKTLEANEFPGDFIKSFLLATTVRFVGILIFFALFLK